MLQLEYALPTGSFRKMPQTKTLLETSGGPTKPSSGSTVPLTATTQYTGAARDLTVCSRDLLKTLQSSTSGVRSLLTESSDRTFSRTQLQCNCNCERRSLPTDVAELLHTRTLQLLCTPRPGSVSYELYAGRGESAHPQPHY